VVDDLLVESTNLVAGANEAGYHLLNVNYPRDYQADVVTDIAAAQEGDACRHCGHILRSVRGIEVANIFKLGTWFSEAMGATYQDKNGKDKPVVMGSYGIGVGRLLASVAEEHHDEHGLIWPITIAPYHVYMVVLPDKKSPGMVEETAEKLYKELQAAGLEVLMDDRDDSPGVKFNDADLIGIPLRITVSGRSLQQDSVEFKRRDQADKRLIPMNDVLEALLSEKITLLNDILEKVKEVHLES
jgi:prolyl-tRNA synthetase